MAEISKAVVKKVGVDLDLKFRDDINDTFENLANKDTEVIKRINNIIADGGESNVEIVDARYSDTKDITYPLLKDRLNDLETDIDAVVHINKAVADQTARYELTNEDVGLNDFVKQLDTNKIYIVSDITKLDSEDGYTLYETYTKSEVNVLLEGKASTVHNHNDMYYTETEVDNKLSSKANTIHIHDYNEIENTPTSLPANGGNADTVDGKHASDFSLSAHDHDDRYYTESEMNTKLNGKSDATHTHDDRYYTETECDTIFATKDEISGTGLGDMLKSIYDTDNDGTVDNADKLDGLHASDFSLDGHTHDDLYYTETEIDGMLSTIGNGDMLKSIYDTDNDGVVNNADKLDGLHASDFAPLSHDHLNFTKQYKMAGRQKTQKIFSIPTTATNTQYHFDVVDGGVSHSIKSTLQVLFGLNGVQGAKIQAYRIGNKTTTYKLRFVVYNDGTNINGYIVSDQYIDNWALTEKHNNGIDIDIVNVGDNTFVPSGTKLFDSDTDSIQVLDTDNISDTVVNLANLSGIKGSGTGSSNTSTIYFTESNGTTKQASIGVKSNNLEVSNIRLDGDLDLKTSGNGRVLANGNEIVKLVFVPTSSTSYGRPGEVAYSADYFYVCVAINTWCRYAKSAW